MDEGLKAAVKKIEEALQDENALRIYHKIEYEKMREANEKRMIEEEIEKNRKEGIEEGIEKGREEGIELAQVKIATKLKKKGIPLEVIANTTELTIEFIEKL